LDIGCFMYPLGALSNHVYVPHDKVVLSIDRTEWDRGSTQYNILCVLASVGKMGVPLYFEMLDNKSGNSNSEDRIRVLKRIGDFGKDRIAYLVMDRELLLNGLAGLKTGY
jgi:hypothetical protein